MVENSASCIGNGTMYIDIISASYNGGCKIDELVKTPCLAYQFKFIGKNSF
jgi:hypothetical protein